MSAFSDHFLDKYFGYRKRYVDYILQEAPARASLAVASEVARLGFSIAGNALCAGIFWLLTVGAAQREGLAVWPVVFGLLALVPTAFAGLSLRGLLAAVADGRRIREHAGARVTGSRP